MRINLSDETEQLNVEVGDATFTVRVLDVDDIARIMRSAGKRDSTQFDRRFSRMFWSEVVLDWDNVTDAAGEPIPCTPDTIVRLMSRLPPIAARLMEAIDEHRQSVVEGFAEKKKA